MPQFNSFILAGGLCLVALGLLAVELFLPSHGILILFSLAFALAGVVVAYMASPLAGLMLGIVVVTAAPFAIYWAIKLYPSTAVGKKVMLARPEFDPAAGYEARARTLAELAGKQGVALSLLRPTGICEIDGRRIDCVAESGLIEAGAAIEVAQVSGLKVTVRKITGA
jgi:membrane-bound serine protease (ClpP class)